MKTPEEIEQLAKKQKDDTNTFDEQYGYLNGYIEGYSQCQEDMADKKYTEEDLENAFNSGRGYGVPDNIKNFNSFINSLNKQD
jgi:hypothetical protein